MKVGGVLKEIKGGFLKVSKSGKEESTGPYEPDDLFKLFVSPLVAESFASPQLDKRSHEETTDSAHELDIGELFLNLTARSDLHVLNDRSLQDQILMC